MNFLATLLKFSTSNKAEASLEFGRQVNENIHYCYDYCSMYLLKTDDDSAPANKSFFSLSPSPLVCNIVLLESIHFRLNGFSRHSGREANESKDCFSLALGDLSFEICDPNVRIVFPFSG